MCLHPPVFRMFLEQLGHGFVSFWIAARDASSSSVLSFVRSLYASQLSFSCHGRSQGTQALAPHLLHLEMSGLAGGLSRSDQLPGTSR